MDEVGRATLNNRGTRVAPSGIRRGFPDETTRQQSCSVRCLHKTVQVLARRAAFLPELQRGECLKPAADRGVTFTMLRAAVVLMLGRVAADGMIRNAEAYWVRFVVFLSFASVALWRSLSSFLFVVHDNWT